MIIKKIYLDSHRIAFICITCNTDFSCDSFRFFTIQHKIHFDFLFSLYLKWNLLSNSNDSNDSNDSNGVKISLAQKTRKQFFFYFLSLFFLLNRKDKWSVFKRQLGFFIQQFSFYIQKNFFLFFIAQLSFMYRNNFSC